MNAGTFGRETLVSRSVFVGIDFEGGGQTAGAVEEPVQVGLACMEGYGGVDVESFFVSLIRAQRGVSARARAVHGIGAGDLVGAPSMLELWPQLAPRLRAGVLVAYGAATERRFLECFPAAGLGPWVDVLPLVRYAFPRWKSHRLGEAVERLGLLAELERLCPGRRGMMLCTMRWRCCWCCGCCCGNGDRRGFVWRIWGCSWDGFFAGLA